MNDKFEITNIKIENFRSIKSLNINVKRMNVFVGLNDVGKSNVLKALNLFFNGQTDYNTFFDFDIDFSKHYTSTRHVAKEIVIELKFIVPSTYKQGGTYTWRKWWRKNDQPKEKIIDNNGKEPSGRNRVATALKRIKYRYVPAIKSKEYYSFLLTELYSTISSLLNNPLKGPIDDFSKRLQEYTLRISNEVTDRIGIKSKLSIPDDLSSLFSTLVFKTTDKDTNVVPLNMRGDGIQARHIPIILKYIADEDQKTRSQGSMKVVTIWGYEEPENGVELSKAFFMAKDFLDYSKDIQMFITSHSPAFYLKNEMDDSLVFHVYAGKAEKDGTKISESSDEKVISNQMGLMPLIAPYVQKAEETRKFYEENQLTDISTIMVEGKTDQQYLTKAIELFSQSLKEMLDCKKLKIFTKEGDGGCHRLIDWSFVWIYSTNVSKAVVLFDCDEAGKKAYDELINHEIYRNKRSSAAIQVKKLYPSDEIISLLQKKLLLNYEIEHLLSISCLRKLIEKNFLVERNASQLSQTIANHMSSDLTINEVLKNVVNNADIVECLIKREPHPDKKMNILKFVVAQKLELQKEYLSPMKKTIEMLEKIFVHASN